MIKDRKNHRKVTMRSLRFKGSTFARKRKKRTILTPISVHPRIHNMRSKEENRTSRD